MPREPDLLPDWFVGGAGKRRLLRGLVLEDPAVAPWDAPPPWSGQTLARAAGLTEKHAVTRHVDVLVASGVLIRGKDGFWLNRRSRLIAPLRELILALDRLPMRHLPASRGGNSTGS